MNAHALWGRLYERIVEILEEGPYSRNSLSKELGRNRFYLRDHLLPDRQDFDLAFEVGEAMGLSPSELLAPILDGVLPEVVLSSLPAAGDDRRENRWRPTSDERLDREFLTAIRGMEGRVGPAPKLQTVPWPKRREDPELAPVYSELEHLDELRRAEPGRVLETCHAAITDGSEAPGGSLRRIGLAGIWCSVQRSRGRLRPARDGLCVTLRLARALGDRSLLADQLQRSASVLRKLGADAVALAASREAAEHYRLDRNMPGEACTLIDRAVLAFHRNDLRLARQLYEAGYRELAGTRRKVYRVSAAQGVATILDLEGDVKGALKSLLAAAAEADPEDRKVRAHLLFPAANIERRLGCLDEAERHYREAARLFSELGQQDYLFRVCLDLANCLVQAGKRAQVESVRSLLKETMPALKDRETLRFQYECLLNELSRESLSSGSLDRLAAELGLRTYEPAAPD